MPTGSKTMDHMIQGKGNVSLLLKMVGPKESNQIPHEKDNKGDYERDGVLWYQSSS